MNIRITRHRKTPEVIDGHLTIDGSVRLCDTAENAVTALPAGTYPVQVLKCHQHARKMPVICLADVLSGSEQLGTVKNSTNPNHSEQIITTPNCSKCEKLKYVSNNTSMPCICPMLKPGNGVYHREDGSIILGTYIAPGCLKHSKEAFDTVYDRIRKSSERGHEITLTIEENYPIVKRTLTNYELGQLLVGEPTRPTIL